jgi:hypothetical protein
VILGPLLVLKLKQSPPGFDRRLVTELWLYPDGSRILELSTKCEPAEAFQVAAETRAFLSSRGVELGSPQQTKTRTALEFFAGQRKSAGGRRRAGGAAKPAGGVRSRPAKARAAR